jgi:microcystin-dependent protein
MSTPFLGEIKIISWNYAPKGWSFCNGQLLPINQNQALFSLFGTTYGGDGRVNFALPDLRGRVPVSFGQTFTLGERAGEYAHTLLLSEMASHNHIINTDAATAATSNSGSPATGNSLGQSVGDIPPNQSFQVAMYASGSPGATLAPQVIGNTGGSQAHNNEQPFLCLNFIVALQGIFPSQN